MRLSCGPTKRGGVGEVRPSKYPTEYDLLHALRYYRVAHELVLNRSKLWVNGLLPSESSNVAFGGRLSYMPDRALLQQAWKDDS
jgi:hypothetical protein